MPNWCFSEYTIVGDPMELEAAYNLMRNLEQMDTPRVDNGFGSTFLGCLIDALGGDWRSSMCRGEWSDLAWHDDRLTFITQTAYAPLNDVWDMLCERYPTLSYYYCAVETGCEVFITNDEKGIYYPQRYWACCNIDEWCEEMFVTLGDALQWINEKAGKHFKSESELNDYRDEDGYSICGIHKIEFIDHETDLKIRQFNNKMWETTIWKIN